MPAEHDKRSEAVNTPATTESSDATDKPEEDKKQTETAEHEDSTRLPYKGKSPETNSTAKSEAGSSDSDKASEALQKMSITDLLSELSSGGKNQKEMASYKFWNTQPVTRFDEQSTVKKDGPIKEIDPVKVSKQPDPLLAGFEWTTLDLTDDKELQELWDLLTYHYVEDDDAMFRFRYSQSFLHWCVISPPSHKSFFFFFFPPLVLT